MNSNKTSQGILLWFALSFLGLMITAACFASWLAPYDPNEFDRAKAFHPLSKIHFRDADGGFSLRPFIYETRFELDENLKKNYFEIRSQKYPIRFFKGKFISVEEPARLYLLGADSRGRDLFSRILYGARISLSIGLAGVLVSVSLGFLVGAISGYAGGRLDRFLMRTAEFFIMIPGFYFLLALRSALPPTLGSLEVYFLIILILSFIGWGGIARVIRGMVLSLREREFVMSSRVLGRNHIEIVMRHIFPHTFPYLGVIISTSIPGYILGESALSVLGLGIQEPAVSWGNLLGDALSVAHFNFHPWVLFPGLFLFLTAFSFNVIGDSLKKERIQ